MKFRKVRQSQTLPWATSTPQQLPFDQQDGYIVGMLLDWQMILAASSPAPNQDYLPRAATSLTVATGSKQFVTISTPDLRTLYWLNRLLFQGGRRLPNSPATSQTISYEMPLLFGLNPVTHDARINERDITAGIPPLKGIVLTINWGSATAMGTGLTLQAGSNVGVTLLLAIPEGNEKIRYLPKWFTSQPTMAVRAALSLLNPLDIDNLYRRSLVMVTVGASPADNRSDSNVTEIGVVNANNDKLSYMESYESSQHSQQSFQVADDNGAYPGATLAPAIASTVIPYNPGVHLIDWKARLPESDKSPEAMDGLLDLDNAKQNAVKMAYTVSSAVNTQITELHCAYVKD